MENLSVWKNVAMIGEGAEGKVFRINGRLAAKVLENPGGEFSSYSRDYAKHRLESECKIARRLYENKVSVPVPHGVFEIDLFANGINVSAFVMQYINGKNLEELMKSNPKIIWERVKNLGYTEIEKAKRLGFHPRDAFRESNIMLSKSGKVYLIDFSLWDNISP